MASQNVEIVWDMSEFELFGSVYHGHQGVRSFWRQWLSAWERIDFEVRELVDAVVAVLWQRNRGRHSGIDVEQGPYAQVWTLRDGRVIRMRYFARADEGLEAAGVRR